MLYQPVFINGGIDCVYGKKTAHNCCNNCGLIFLNCLTKARAYINYLRQGIFFLWHLHG